MDIINNANGMILSDEETGEVLVDGIQPGDKVRIIRKEQLEAKRRLEADTVPLNSGRKFIKQFPDMSARLCERLTPNAVWLLNLLMPYVGMNSGIIRHRNGAFVKRTDIVRLCGTVLAERTADRAVSELCEKGVLTTAGMQNGSRANATLLGLFKDTEWVKYGG